LEIWLEPHHSLIWQLDDKLMAQTFDFESEPVLQVDTCPEKFKFGELHVDIVIWYTIRLCAGKASVSLFKTSKY
jgi:hypothetical protein